MKIKKGLSGYPILIAGDDDYVDSFFDAEMNYQNEFNQLTINVKLTLKNDGLDDLINQGKALYVVHYECPSLCFREMEASNDKNISHVIDMNSLSDVLEVSTYIVANSDIEKYYNEKFNWEYGKDGFPINKGSILAIGPTYTIDIDRANDGLKKLPDVIQIKEYENDDRKEMKVVLEGPIITIMVSKNVKDIYYNIGGQDKYFNIIISMIMVPAMIQVLVNMKENEDGLKDFQWFKVISALLEKNGIEVNQLNIEDASGKFSVYEIAQKIFKSPIEKGFMDF